MTRITENSIEEFAIELLDKLGYEYIYAPNIASEGETQDANLSAKFFAFPGKYNRRIW